MRRKTTFAAFFVIAALVLGLSAFILPGCSSSDSTTNNENVIQGTITDTDTGAKLEGVTIVVGDKTTTSDSSGSYKLSGFIGGRHILKASKSGYGNYSAEVIVSSWQPTTHDFSMTGNTPGEIKVMGTVTDGTWTPLGIEGVTVTVGGKSTTTDSDGKYEITGIEVKNMTLTATKTAYTDYAADIDVSEGSTTTHNFVLPLAPDAELPFASTATNFTTLFPTPSPTSTVSPTSTPSPTNLPQIYLRHKYEGTTEPISLASPGVLVPGQAYDVSISANGRWTVFNYYPPRDTSLGETRAFQGYAGVYVYDKETGTIENISLGTSSEQINGEFHAIPRRAISADGRYVVYHSSATNLVENDNNNDDDIFVYDRETKTTKRISMGYSGDEVDDNSRKPAISADGRYVVYESEGTNIVEGYTSSDMSIYRYDMQTGTTEIVSVTGDGTDADDGSYNAFASADGTYVVFQSWADNLTSINRDADQDVYVKNMSTGEIEFISQNAEGVAGNGSSLEPTVSADGNYVTFVTEAQNLGGTPDAERNVYLRNRAANETILMSQNAEGTGGDRDSTFASISGDGSVVYFDSEATNLVDNDTNNRSDSFLYYVKTGLVERFTISSDGEEGNGYSFQFAIF